MLVVVDYLPKYPLVEKVDSTGGLDNIVALYKLFKSSSF